MWRPYSPDVFVYRAQKIAAPDNMPKKTSVSATMTIYNTDIITTAIEPTKRLYQEEMDLRAIDYAEDEGMIVHQSVTPSEQHTG